MIFMNDFVREYQSIQPKIKQVVQNCLASGWYILGQEGKNFEKAFAEYCGTSYCVGVANGLEAIQVSLLALGIGEGDEVITVSNSAVATALAITAVGATPIFVDIDEFYHIDMQKIQEAITDKTKAIIPVHLFGQVCDIENICKYAKTHNIYVIEDACQAHGGSVNGKRAGSFGSTGCFSFYPTKNLGAYGDGGAITTNSKRIYEKCCKLRNYGQSQRYYHDFKGVNSRLDEIQAAVLNYKLGNLNKWLIRRNEIANLYFSLLQHIPQLVLPKTRTHSYHSFHLFVIQCNERNSLQEYLKNSGVETLIHYPVPIHKQVCYKEFKDLSLPETEKAAGHLLSLPIHPYLTDKEIRFVCNKIISFYQKRFKVNNISYA